PPGGEVEEPGADQDRRGREIDRTGADADQQQATVRVQVQEVLRLLEPCTESLHRTKKPPSAKGFSSPPSSCTLARPIAMIAATAPSIFSRDCCLSGLMLPAGSCVIARLLTFQLKTGCPPCRIRPATTSRSNSFAAGDIVL